MELAQRRLFSFLQCKVVELAERIVHDGHTGPATVLEEPVDSSFDDFVLDDFTGYSGKPDGFWGNLADSVNTN